MVAAQEQSGKAPEAKTCATPLEDLVEDFSLFPRDGEDAPKVAKGNALPQIHPQLEVSGV